MSEAKRDDRPEYQIIERTGVDAAEKVEAAVRRLLLDGWRPLGGASVSRRQGWEIIVVQAMIRGQILR